jgi:hypothetical protein
MNARTVRKVLPLVAAIFIAGVLSEALSQPFSISGYVRTSRGAAVAGVTMDGLPGPPLTDASGFYTATVEYRWSGTVTPFLAGRDFSPPSITYSNVTSNKTNQNYSATLQKFTISGHVRTSAGQSFPGVTLVGLPGPPVSDANGFYTATVEWGWNGEFSASFYGYLFQPLARKILFVLEDCPDQDFTAFPAVTVWGRDDMPQEYYLHQNNPNPFNPSTTIKYELPKSSEVRLSVYDMLGREVSVLVNERRDAGVHEVKFESSNLASGVYFYRLRAGDFVQTRKLLLCR